MYAAELIIIVLMQSYIPSLFTAPIGVFIVLVIYLLAPIAVFFRALANVKDRYPPPGTNTAQTTGTNPLPL
jgi:hypothetical protein